MNYSNLSIVIGIILLVSKDFKPVITGRDWETANAYCRYNNDSLPDIQDVNNNLSYLRGRGVMIWSSVRGQFTPWIAYRGCFYENLHLSLTDTNFTNSTCHHLENNSAGNCYFKCKSKIYTNGGCANTANFFFGLQNLVCFCMCDDTIIKHISESTKCNLSCGTSINDGECGGIGYLSVYETINIALPGTHFGGFCQTCHKQSDSSDTQLYSRDCNEIIAGYCVKNNMRVSLPPMVSTFASYWNHCKEQKMYIVGDISHKFCQKDSNVWTGLRKYKIDNSNIDNDSCYIIEINQETVNYKKSNCTEDIFFLCKNEIYHHPVISIENTKSTKKTSQLPLTPETSRTATILFTPLTTSISDAPNSTIATSISPPPESEGYTTAIVGASIAGVVLLSFVFLIIYLLKRRRFQSKQSNQQQAKSAIAFHNTTYDDLVVTNQTQEVNYANATPEKYNRRIGCNKDDIYMEKEEEYDHLHTNRQKKATMQADDDRYGSASYFEDDSYSTLRVNRNVDADLDNEYSVNSMPYSENQSGAVNSPEYDYCYQAN